MSMATEIRLTTSDNPYDPFKNPIDWEAWDTRHGYCTNAYIARVANLSDELSDSDEASEIDRAIYEIYRMNVTGNYKIVTREVNEA